METATTAVELEFLVKTFIAKKSAHFLCICTVTLLYILVLGLFWFWLAWLIVSHQSLAFASPRRESSLSCCRHSSLQHRRRRTCSGGRSPCGSLHGAPVGRWWAPWPCGQTYSLTHSTYQPAGNTWHSPWPISGSKQNRQQFIELYTHLYAAYTCEDKRSSFIFWWACRYIC